MKKNTILLTIVLLFLMTFVSYSEENNVENIGKFKPKQIRYADNKVSADDYYFDEETENDFNNFVKEKTSNNNFTIISKKPDKIIIKENGNKYLIKLDLPDSYYFDNFYRRNDDNGFIHPSILGYLNRYRDFEWGSEQPISQGTIFATTELGEEIEIPYYYPYTVAYDSEHGTYHNYNLKILKLKLCDTLTVNDFINKTSKIDKLKSIYIEENGIKEHYILERKEYGDNLKYQFGKFYGFYRKDGESYGKWYELKGITEVNCEKEKKNEPIEVHPLPTPKNEEVDNKVTPSNINKKVTDSNLTNKTTPSNIINKVTNSNISKDNKENNTNQKPQTNYSQVKQNITQNNENAVTNDLNKKELSNEEENKIESKINDVNKTRNIKTSDNLLGNLFFILSLIAITSGYLFVNYKKIKNK